MSEHINVEIKAKVNNASEIRSILLAEKPKMVGVDHQVDTYFYTNTGRLKLRQGNIENTLIHYVRENKGGPKVSKVHLFQTEGRKGLRELLLASQGIKVEVDKIREILFIDNVKFHIDKVKGLGDFVEIEAIDKDGSLGLEKINQQCHHFLKMLKIDSDNLIEVSYSDLLLEKNALIFDRIQKEFTAFMSELFKQLSARDLLFSKFVADHACYRVQTDQEYHDYFSQFSQLGDLLITSEVGGREISTFKLHRPLSYGARKIDVIELPFPKNDSPYPTGFEHIEMVIPEDFQAFQKRYPKVEFDWSGTKMSFNPELRLKLKQNLSIKFHHQSLEQVIATEKRTLEE